MGGKGYVAKYKGKLTPKQRQRLGIPNDAEDVRETTVGGVIRVDYTITVNGVKIHKIRWIEKKEKEIKRK